MSISLAAGTWPALDAASLPRHVAIIMDGNRRWARERGLPAIEGHRRGMIALRHVTRAASDLGIKALTVYGFSTENWNRDEREISLLFELCVHFARNELIELRRNNVRVRVIGDWESLPPAPRRALVLLDPSYEDKRDYSRTLRCVEESLKRFPTGTYAVWYPQVKRPESQRFPDQLKQLQKDNWLHVSLTVSNPPADGFGLFGSGMFILNPPYTLAKMLKEQMPWLVKTLGEDKAATFKVEYRGN